MIDKKYVHGLMTMEDFVNSHEDQYPELCNYMGFSGGTTNDDVEMDDDSG